MTFARFTPGSWTWLSVTCIQIPHHSSRLRWKTSWILSTRHSNNSIARRSSFTICNATIYFNLATSHISTYLLLNSSSWFELGLFGLDQDSFYISRLVHYLPLILARCLSYYLQILKCPLPEMMETVIWRSKKAEDQFRVGVSVTTAAGTTPDNTGICAVPTFLYASTHNIRRRFSVLTVLVFEFASLATCFPSHLSLAGLRVSKAELRDIIPLYSFVASRPHGPLIFNSSSAPILLLMAPDNIQV